MNIPGKKERLFKSIAAKNRNDIVSCMDIQRLEGSQLPKNSYVEETAFVKGSMASAPLTNGVVSAMSTKHSDPHSAYNNTKESTQIQK